MAEGRYVNPFILGFGVAQQMRDNAFRQQVFDQRVMEVEQLRQQQTEQNALSAIHQMLTTGNEQAAQNIYDSVVAPKRGPAKLTVAKGEGDVVGHVIDREGGYWNVTRAGGLVRGKAEGPAAVVGTLPGSNVATQPEGPISTESILPQPTFAVPGQAAEKTLNVNDLAAFVSSAGQVRGPSIPANMTVEQGRSALTEIQTQRQVLTPEAERQRIGIAAATGAQAAQARAGVEAQQKIVQGSGTTFIIDRIGELVNALPSNPGGIGRFAGGARAYMQGILQSPGVGENVAELDVLRTSYATNLSRSILSERGVLTDQDRKYAINSIPTVFDSDAIRQKKIANFKAMNDLIKTGEDALAAGVPLDTKAFREKIRTLSAAGISSPQTTPRTAPQGGVLRGTSKSGKPIHSNDGGKTWEYD